MIVPQAVEERRQIRALSVRYTALGRLQIQTTELDTALKDVNGTMRT